MAKHLQTAEHDVAHEEYKGPSAVSAAAGEGFIAHYQWAAIGLVVGTLAATLFHKPAAKLVESCRTGCKKLFNTPFSVIGKTGIFVFGHGQGSKAHLEESFKHLNPIAHATDLKELQVWTKSKEVGFGYSLLDHTLGKIPGIRGKVQEWLKNGGEQASNAVSVGGILAAVGFFIVPLFLAPKGALKGMEGKKQFDRAKSEIQTTRQENHVLRNQLAEARASLPNDKSLRVAEDNTPVMQDAAQTAPHQTPADLERATAASVLADSPTEITPPKVQEPKIEEPRVKDPKFPQEPNWPWGDKISQQRAAAEAQPQQHAPGA